MAKSKSVYVCSECGYQSPKWLGKCPSCNQWNTMEEEKEAACFHLELQYLQTLIQNTEKEHRKFVSIKLDYLNHTRVFFLFSLYFPDFSNVENFVTMS